MPLIPDPATFQKRLAALPLRRYEAGEFVLSARSKTGQLLILRNGAVAVLKGTTEIATVTEAGAIFGELSVLLDQPHAADVRALEPSQFYVADAAALVQDPTALLHIAAVLARRLHSANQVVVELQSQLQAGQPPGVIDKTFEKIEGLLGASGASLVYAGYPMDPYASR